MSTGTVKFFNETKGFGFIKEEESGKEYFVHVTGLVDKIRENDNVTFEIQEGKKGLNAVNVKLSQLYKYHLKSYPRRNSGIFFCPKILQKDR